MGTRVRGNGGGGDGEKVQGDKVIGHGSEERGTSMQR